MQNKLDVFGQALTDYFYNRQAAILWLHNSYDEPEEMPVEVFFRTEDEMPERELIALNLCRGRVLDIGAGVGSHALILQKRGIDVTAIDICSEAIQIMQARNVKQAICQNVFDTDEKYDTLLMLMNGIGLCNTLSGLATFLDKAVELLNPDGQLIFDSSDISYLYEDSEIPKNKYFGEINFAYEYKGQKGNWFNWLYIDPITMQNIAIQKGWKFELINKDEQDQYLARLSLT